MTAQSRLGNGRSHSAVVGRKVTGETPERTFPEPTTLLRLPRMMIGYRANTLDLAGPDVAAVAMTPRVIATVIADAPWIVSLPDFP